MQKKGWLTDKDFNFIYSRAPRICVDLIIKNKQGNVLLTFRKIRPYKNKWHLPGGTVLFRESIDGAIQRIALSELNSSVKVHKLLGYMEFLRETKGKHKRHAVSLVFLVELVNRQISGSFQAEKFQYFSKIPKNTLRIHSRFLISNLSFSIK